MKIHSFYNEQDEIRRWNSYARANSTFPLVRNSEIKTMLKYINPQKGDRIVEVGTGNGFLTYPIAEAVDRIGLVYSFDYRRENLFHALERNIEGYPIVFIPQGDNPQLATYSFPINSNSIDKVVSLAALHHYDDRSLESGISGRLEALKEFYRILLSGGEIIIGDVAHNTSTQKYFDGEMNNPDSPAYCNPRGHPHDFLDERLANQLCREAGFKDISFRIEKTHLTFESERQAGTFLKMVHNAPCLPSESLKIAKKYKTFKKKNEFYELEWENFFMRAIK